MQLYCDPNAKYNRKIEPPKQKVDLNHIEKIMYPQNYNNIETHYDKNAFCPPPKPVPQPKPNFDLSQLLGLLGGNSNLSSLLPSLLKNIGADNQLLSLLKKTAPTKKVEAKVIEKSDSISKYERVKD